MAIKNKCKYCLAPLDERGFCSRPCRMGKLLKKKAELEEQNKENKNSDNAQI